MSSCEITVLDVADSIVALVMGMDDGEDTGGMVVVVAVLLLLSVVVLFSKVKFINSSAETKIPR